MFAVELIERKVGDTYSKRIPLDNLCSGDLDFIKSLGCGMTEEIYNQSGNINRVRKCDAHYINLDTVRIVLIKECILLWTILLSNVKQRPQLDQVCIWLNETKHTHKGELMFVEREIHETVESVGKVGPEILFGDTLGKAMEGAPRTREDFSASTLDIDLLSDNDMLLVDLDELFNLGCVEPDEILFTDEEDFGVDFIEMTQEEEIACIIDVFFSNNTPMGEKELTLTEEVV